mmetsp:Transcript_4359/g.12571  ORF Transcript_4359/g.12571 Transcript_4359/m.12571 type:complete len:454 (-) Transcript_4359:421-1782(-)
MVSSSVFPITGLLLFGTITSLFAKIVYELDGVGREGHHKLFQKPWAMTCVMFFGMSLCLPLAYWQQWQKQKAASDNAAEPLLSATSEELGAEAKTSELREVCLLAIPTVFDLMATVLMNIGLLSVTASVYQMMRGAEMLFAAAFSVIFLHRVLNRKHVGGILCCVVGIGLVGTASLLSGEGSASHPVTQAEMIGGMSLIVLSQAVQAAQITFEDFFLSSMDIAPLKIVGYEGLWGSLIMVLFLLPIVQRTPGIEGGGFHEDTIDTLHMIGSNKVILIILLVDMSALLLYNVSGMCVTGNLGAVFRTVLETTRTLFVWLVDLLLFYTPLGFGQLGESWSVYSFIQAAGFVVLVTGTMIYGKGDEVAEKEAIEEMQAEGALPEAPPTPGARAMPPGRRVSSSGISFARDASGASVPIMMTPSSMKSTMNINAFRGSYVGSYTAGGLHGSLSRSHH